jgi:hypothetical protein
MWMLTAIVALDTSLHTYYSPWFPKGADNGVFAVEVTGNTLPDVPVGTVFSVLTKNREDEGSAPASAVGSTTLTSGTPGIYELNCAGLKDLVRFQVAFRAGSAGQGLICRLLPPTWYDTAV